MVWDATAMAVTRESEMMRESLAAGAIDRCRDAARARSAPRPAEADTASCSRRCPGRRRLEAPYHLAWVTHGVLASQGGAVIDPHGRVLDATGAAIPGLYAGGGTACGLAGASSDGYISGNGLLQRLRHGLDRRQRTRWCGGQPSRRGLAGSAVSRPRAVMSESRICVDGPSAATRVTAVG